MPPRIKKIRHDDETRAKIQAAQIINRLHGCVMGEVALDAQQVSAAKTLLAKVLPDLQSVEMQADVVTNVVSTAPMSPAQWKAQHAGDED